ncbi:NADPH cytochrome P450 oxidoreductase family protein [Pseudooceanicola sediminis]|uniref:NADPH cytochrome P450 oxidoreductase family protein n=1 Tax=Pseudooceanicola sediminis TaxID=2211117 RepID=UPI001314DB8C|nr:NADPH cytochrome P450 oxidoreductase family protein [Pseudooceanicola sediminis]
MIPALTLSAFRISLAVVLGLGWLAVLLWQRRAAATAPGGGDTASGDTLVLFASQSGLAERLAWDQARRLGTTPHPLDSVTPQILRRASTAWFLLASAGDGEAPDNARAFARRLGALRQCDLTGLRYGLLALGDRRYPAFCGFGRQVDAALVACGAHPLFPRVEVDRGAPADLAQWHARVGADTPGQWRLTERRLLTPRQAGDPAYHLRLRPDVPVEWTPGAIADVALLAPDGTPQQRSYSVASLPQSGEVELILRRRHGPDGPPGLGSAWLTAGLAQGGRVQLSLRDSPHMDALAIADRDDQPLLMIATGTGLAAVLGPLRARLAGSGTAPLWLVHGERHAAFAPLRDLARTGPDRLRIDCVLSRGPRPQRLPDWIRDHAEALSAFVAPGAPGRQPTLFVCGSRDPGRAILAALGTSLNASDLHQMQQSGRFLTDFY